MNWKKNKRLSYSPAYFPFHWSGPQRSIPGSPPGSKRIPRHKERFLTNFDGCFSGFCEGFLTGFTVHGSVWGVSTLTWDVCDLLGVTALFRLDDESSSFEMFWFLRCSEFTRRPSPPSLQIIWSSIKNWCTASMVAKNHRGLPCWCLQNCEMRDWMTTHGISAKSKKELQN